MVTCIVCIDVLLIHIIACVAAVGWPWAGRGRGLPLLTFELTFLCALPSPPVSLGLRRGLQ
jgi:hypothetical protein